MNANVPMLDEIAGKNTKEVIGALHKTIRQQQAEIEALKAKRILLKERLAQVTPSSCCWSDWDEL